MEYNDRQTPFDKLLLENAPEEIRLQYDDFTNNVPFINWMLGERPRAKDLPRDEYGRIIVDVTKPHILEDMDYFRPTAIHYQKTGKLCDFKPNGNPNSDYGAWVREETRRCLEGYVRQSDGEWITGDYYFFLNYCPIQLSRRGRGKKANRVVDFPFVWDGHYLVTHYLHNARMGGHHAWELARRGSGKSFLGASLLAKRFILGESYEVNKRVQCVVTASERKYLTGANQILDMFQSYIDFCAMCTEWPYLRLMDSKQNLQWIMGYKDIDTGVSKGTLNSVIGISSKDDDSKLRGSRGVLYLIEECGTFARLLDTYNTMRPSVEDGDSVFGMIFGYGTSGSNDSDFRSSQEIMYNPDGYNVLSLENVYDKVGQGRSRFCYFFPGYLNRSECYDNNGNSDVSKALVEILKDRYITKYNSTDPNTITKRIAEIPITPQEAVLRVVGNLFPVSDLNARLNQLDTDTSEYQDVYTGELVVDNKGEVKFSPTSDTPIRVWPTKDNKVKGAIEFYAMPEKDNNGKVYKDRYILGHDPADNDVAETMSLTSTFVLDLWTDRIVAEYTGRQDYADDNFEIVRKLCIFYNGKCLYEQNKKGIFAYFSKMNCLYLLADTPEYLKDKQLIKSIGYGNTSKGVNATQPINNFADNLIKEWLIKPVIVNTEEGGEVKEVQVKNLSFIKCRALLMELISYNPFANFDRIRALGMLMLYREQYMVMWGGEVRKTYNAAEDKSYLGNDDFFSKNYRR